VDEAWTILDAYIPSRHSTTFNNLMSRRVPTIPEKRFLRSRVARTELALNDIAIGLMVHVAPEFGISC
jgi:hypothetical protein